MRVFPAVMMLTIPGAFQQRPKPLHRVYVNHIERIRYAVIYRAVRQNDRPSRIRR